MTARGLSLEKRFMLYVSGPDENGCLIFSGAKTFGLKIEKTYHTKYVHHVAWFIAHGEWPKELVKNCNTLSCVNPNHFEKINQNNITKRIQHVKGVNNYNSKLDDLQVEEMRMLFHDDKVTARQLGIWFGISKTQVYHVVWNESWKV